MNRELDFWDLLGQLEEAIRRSQENRARRRKLLESARATRAAGSKPRKGSP